MQKRSLIPMFLIAAATIPFLAGCQSTPGSIEEVRTTFADPPREYSSGPLWVWNDMLTEEQVVGTLRDLASQHIKQVWVHPRPGLMTPYLSDAWFKLWKAALDEGKRLDMNVWIYDENSYPSGFAGGFVPEEMPESRGRGVAIRESKLPPAWSDDLIAVYSLSDSAYENVSEKVKAGTELPEGRYLACMLVRAGNSPWFADRCYVDLMYPGVTEKFIDVTLEAYRKHFGDQFGKRIPGTFTDEPHLRPADGLPWTQNLPELFRQRWGYELTDHLPCLYEAVGEFKKVRHNYFKLLLEQFQAHWGKPLHDYCEQHDLAFTGHYWEHEWPNCMQVPDNMAMYAWHQVPAIDTLFNQYAENTHAQFGNARAVRELASVANQLGRTRTLCEAYGAGAWEMRFEDMKRIGDWLYVLGVNTLNQHLSYITIRGARKHDHPPSFSYHEPWWEAYHLSADYFRRLSYALTRGQQVHRILLLEPTTTAWMYHGSHANNPQLGQIGETFFQMVMDLERHQVEYDIGCEEIIGQRGTVKGGMLVVGERSYQTLVIPPMTENLNAETALLLDAFVRNGGRVLCSGQPPTLVDGEPWSGGTQLANLPMWQKVEANEVPNLLLAGMEEAFAIHRAPGDKGILFHHRRQLDGGELLFLVNSSIESPSEGTIVTSAKGVERWDAQTGKTAPYPFKAADGARASFHLPPCGSLLLFLSHTECPAAPEYAEQVTTFAPIGEPVVSRLDPNVLHVDYVDVTAGGETKRNVYFYEAGQFVFQKHGLERIPWDAAVQFHDELISKSFPADSGFEVTYRFTIETSVPGNVGLVVERADLYTVTCNDQKVVPSDDIWWLDKAFHRMDITALARPGENVVTLKASPFNMYHEIAPIFILGDFALRPASAGFIISPQRPLVPGRWNEQGLPLYGHKVSYREEFELEQVAGRYQVSLPAWHGSVAEVKVNGQHAGDIYHQPWECDVTARVHKGTNVVEVTVIGTLKNTLGPHHGDFPLGLAGPGHFRVGPSPGPPAGEKYATVGYGLFEPFVLKQVTPVQ